MLKKIKDVKKWVTNRHDTVAKDQGATSASNTKWSPLTRGDLGDSVPRRGGIVSPLFAKVFLKAVGWQVVGDIPNVPKAIYLALPHTSNFDAVYAIPTLLSLDLDINIMGKESLFKNPVMAKFLTWSGIIPINRSAKGTVLQASIERLKTSDKLHLGLSPEGQRGYSDKWKTGFYYIAQGADVPIIPIAMDYRTKQVRFMAPVYTTGDMQADIDKIIAQYEGVVPKHPESLSQPLQDMIKPISTDK